MSQEVTNIYQGCEFPVDLLYDVEREVWVRLEADGTVTMGMTDPAQAQCGKFVHIRFKAVGRHLARGQITATIESAKWVGPFPTPLGGELVATNEAGFKQDILLANKDPFGAGWLIKVRPDRPDEEIPLLLTFAQAYPLYQAKIAEKKIKCYRCAD